MFLKDFVRRSALRGRDAGELEIGSPVFVIEAELSVALPYVVADELSNVEIGSLNLGPGVYMVAGNGTCDPAGPGQFITILGNSIDERVQAPITFNTTDIGPFGTLTTPSLVSLVETMSIPILVDSTNVQSDGGGGTLTTLTYVALKLTT